MEVERARDHGGSLRGLRFLHLSVFPSIPDHSVAFACVCVCVVLDYASCGMLCWLKAVIISLQVKKNEGLLFVCMCDRRPACAGVGLCDLIRVCNNCALDQRPGPL